MKRILLYGNSIFLAGMANTLQGMLELTLVQFDALEAPLCPETDLILVDQCETTTINLLSELCEQGISVAIINPTNGTLTIFSGKSCAVNSIPELAMFLKNQEILPPKNPPINASTKN